MTLSLTLTIPAYSQQKPQAEKPQYLQEAKGISAADRLEILDVIARMNQAIDANDYKAYASFYSEDGVIDSGFGEPSRGREAIFNSVQQSAPFITNKRHIPGNFVFSGNLKLVTVVFYLTVFERATSLTLAGTAHITDTFVRKNGRWEVATHVTRMDPATVDAMTKAMSKLKGK